MTCPKCNGFLELTERFWDYDDGELLSGEEHYYCPKCFEVYNRDVTYVLEKASDIE